MGEVLGGRPSYPHCVKKWCLKLRGVVNELDSCLRDRRKETGKSETGSLG